MSDINPELLNTIQFLANQKAAEKNNWKTKKLDLPSFDGVNLDG